MAKIKKTENTNSWQDIEVAKTHSCSWYVSRYNWKIFWCIKLNIHISCNLAILHLVV